MAEKDAQEICEDAIERVDGGANLEWKKYAENVVYELCIMRYRFTTDDVWDKMEGCGLRTETNRALGAVMRHAAKNGWCKATGEYQKSRGINRHRMPILIWESCLL